MKKKLIIIGSILGVLVLCFVLLFPFLMNKRKNVLYSPDNNIYGNVTVDYDDIINQYQKYLNYQNYIEYFGSAKTILNLNIIPYSGGYADSYQYALGDLNGDEIDELVIKSVDEDYNDIVDIYYYDGTSAKRVFGDMQTSGFWGRNRISILGNGQFETFGSDGAGFHTSTYYGNIQDPTSKVSDWSNFGKILEETQEYETTTYTLFDSATNSKNISKSKFESITNKLGAGLNIDDWDWKTITSTPNFVPDDKYKVYDYFYLIDKDTFVKGISLGEKFYSDIIMSRDKLYIQYPKLFNIAKEIGYDMTFCIITSEATNGQHKCEVDLSTYKYPTFYQIQSSGNWEFFFISSDIYYDSNNDGYVDSTGIGYFIAPIDQYDSKYGPLV